MDKKSSSKPSNDVSELYSKLPKKIKKDLSVSMKKRYGEVSEEAVKKDIEEALRTYLDYHNVDIEKLSQTSSLQNRTTSVLYLIHILKATMSLLIDNLDIGISSSKTKSRNSKKVIVKTRYGFYVDHSNFNPSQKYSTNYKGVNFQFSKDKENNLVLTVT